MSEPRFSFVARVDGADPDPSTSVGWRLLGRNNHEMARSASGFDDVGAAHDAVLVLQERIDDVYPAVRVLGTDRLWSWQLSLDDVAVAVSGRAYRREREAAQSVEHFLEVAPVALVPGSLHERLGERDRPEASSAPHAEFTRVSPEVRLGGPAS